MEFSWRALKTVHVQYEFFNLTIAGISRDDLCRFQLGGRSETPGSEFCPRIENINSDLSQVLVPSSSEVNVTVIAKHLQVCSLSLRKLVGGVAQWLGRRSLAGGLSHATFIHQKPVVKRD